MLGDMGFSPDPGCDDVSIFLSSASCDHSLAWPGFGSPWIDTNKNRRRLLFFTFFAPSLALRHLCRKGAPLPHCRIDRPTRYLAPAAHITTLELILKSRQKRQDHLEILQRAATTTTQPDIELLANGDPVSLPQTLGLQDFYKCGEMSDLFTIQSFPKSPMLSH
jgi:hypothetical protein